MGEREVLMLDREIGRYIDSDRGMGERERERERERGTDVGLRDREIHR